MRYNIVMFAYNEEANIATSIRSIFDNVDDDLNAFYLIANGCSDNTVAHAEQSKDALGFDKLIIKEIELGDKCNAWNTYIHEYSDNVETHFFTDADVRFSSRCFPQLSQKLSDCPPQTVAIAGMPLSGRNIAFYRELVTERACFFGNLYGLRHSFIQRMQSAKFRLPIGLNWIDSFLTKAVNTDLSFSKENLPQRTTWIDGVGYEFDSLSAFKRDDIKLYINRIARYELGKIQEFYLDKTPVREWPASMSSINDEIWRDFSNQTNHLSWIKTLLVKKRLKKLIGAV